MIQFKATNPRKIYEKLIEEYLLQEENPLDEENTYIPNRREESTGKILLESPLAEMEVWYISENGRNYEMRAVILISKKSRRRTSTLFEKLKRNIKDKEYYRFYDKGLYYVSGDIALFMLTPSTQMAFEATAGGNGTLSRVYTSEELFEEDLKRFANFLTEITNGFYEKDPRDIVIDLTP